jgi:hypothetical protein
VAIHRDPGVEVRALRPGDNLDVQLDLAEMAGVASVRAAPEDRGRGIGRAVMTALLDEVAAQGYPLSVLYPATMPLYRSLGWELAGGNYTAVIPARSLVALAPPDALGAPPADVAAPPEMRRAGPADVAEVLAVIGRVHEAARDCGPITWSAATVGRWLTEPDFTSTSARTACLSTTGTTGTRTCSSRARRRFPRRPCARSGPASAHTPRWRIRSTRASARRTRSGGCPASATRTSSSG